MPRVESILLDLFGTLIDWDPSTLPEIEVDGRRIRSTVPLLEPILDRFAVPREPWRLAYLGVIAAIQRARLAADVEVTCLERFERSLETFLDAQTRAACADELRARHMEAVREAARIPRPHRDTVAALSNRHALGILSNFDDAETGHAIIADTGCAGHFEHVVISAETGLRKPHPQIYRRFLERAEWAAPRTLFVGDTAAEDVRGAVRAGLRVAWIDRKGPYPPDEPAPELRIAALPELAEVLPA